MLNLSETFDQTSTKGVFPNTHFFALRKYLSVLARVVAIYLALFAQGETSSLRDGKYDLLLLGASFGILALVYIPFWLRTRQSGNDVVTNKEQRSVEWDFLTYEQKLKELKRRDNR